VSITNICSIFNNPINAFYSSSPRESENNTLIKSGTGEHKLVNLLSKFYLAILSLLETVCFVGNSSSRRFRRKSKRALKVGKLAIGESGR
jgi:hypothetical protein